MRLPYRGAEEREPALLAFWTFFCVLFSYFLIVPVREEIAISLGVNILPKLFSGSLLATCIAAPLTAQGVYSGTGGQGHRRLFTLLAAVLGAFYVASTCCAPPVKGAQLSAFQSATFCSFYVWLGLQNLVSVSALWALCADRFNADEAARLFGFIGAGATLGQLLGSAASVSYVRAQAWMRATAGQAPPFELLLVASCMLLLAGHMCQQLASTAHSGGGGGWAGQAATTAEEQQGQRHQTAALHRALHLDHPHRPCEPLTPDKLQPSLPLSTTPARRLFTSALTHVRELSQSLRLIARSRYLLTLCAFTALTYTTSAILYFERALVVSSTMARASTRSSYFALINMSTALLIFATQMLATGRVIKALGVRPVLFISPVVALCGMLIVAWRPNAGLIAGVEVARKVIGYSLSRPTREILFTVLSRQEKYRAKILIDIVVQRVGDGVAAALFELLEHFKLSSGPGGPLATAGSACCCLWCLASYALGRLFEVQRSKLKAHASDSCLGGLGEA